MSDSLYPDNATSHGRSSTPPATGKTGMVASAHPYATEAGLDILRQGGNAFDAIVAVATTLNVVEPFMSGMGGIGVALVYIAKEKRTRVLNFSGHAPKAANPVLYNEDNIETGPLAPLIPGNVGGWLTMHNEYGSADRSTLFRRAISYASEGVALTPFNVANMILAMERLEQFEPSLEALDFDASNLSIGSVLRQPMLSDSLAAVADGGIEEFYEGKLGDRIIEGHRALGGIIDREELASYRPYWQEPLTVRYRGLEARVPPPNSAGFQILETLNIMNNLDMAAYGSAETLHMLMEAVFLAADDRAKYAGDPSLVEVPIQRLLSDEYAKKLAQMIDKKITAGPPPERWNRSRVDHVPEDLGAPYESGMTTHFAIADSEGNVITVTQTLGGGFGSCVAPSGTGVFLNNMCKWFDIDPSLGSPNLIGSGKQVDFCLAPVQLFDVSSDESPKIRLSIGTPGSYGILHTSAQMVHHVVDAGMNVQEAIEAPRFRFFDDGTLLIENRFPENILKSLYERGHKFRHLPPFHAAVGGGHGIQFTKHGTMLGGADPRRGGIALGF